MIYLIAAFTWWAILLYKKNNEHLQLATQLQKYDQSIDLEAIQSEFVKQKKMIIGEGLVFALSIIAGLFLINRAFWKELELNRNISNFLLSVTHELKTPLATLGLLHKTLANKQLPENKKQELIDTAIEESARLESLVNNILTAAQLEQSYPYNFESTDYSGLVRSRVSRFKRINPTRAFTVDIEEDITASIDREAFTKLIDNLLDNAIKYAPADQAISVSLHHVDNQIMLAISDLGPGISQAEKGRVRQRFYRVGNEDTRESKGTGLGLFIVSEIVKAHHGDMQIKDNYPRGTTIQVSLKQNL